MVYNINKKRIFDISNAKCPEVGVSYIICLDNLSVYKCCSEDRVPLVFSNSWIVNDLYYKGYRWELVEWNDIRVYL
jgi:hypothetical protein